MTKKFIILLAAGVLSICLLSGGCFKTDESKISDFKELLKLPTKNQAAQKTDKQANAELPKIDLSKQDVETIAVSLYFGNASASGLATEERNIEKVEGVARRTVEELFNGPVNTKEYSNVFPEGTRLLDINVRPDGICIVDLSGEVSQVENEQQEKLMVYAITNTLSQFPSIERVKFRIDGQEVETLGGFVQLGEAVEPNLKI